MTQEELNEKLINNSNTIFEMVTDCGKEILKLHEIFQENIDKTIEMATQVDQYGALIKKMQDVLSDIAIDEKVKGG